MRIAKWNGVKVDKFEPFKEELMNEEPNSEANLSKNSDVVEAEVVG
jgi:hypothetical protein